MGGIIMPRRYEKVQELLTENQASGENAANLFSLIESNMIFPFIRSASSLNRISSLGMRSNAFRNIKKKL